jgi:hypothetical protein
MQRLSGVLMVLAGTALGGYFVLAAPQLSAEKRAEATLLAAPAVAATAVPALSLPVAATVSAAPIVTAPIVSANGTRIFSQASPLQAPSPVAASPSKATWTAVVTTEPTANGKLTSSRPGDATTRGVLASDLQRELTRVGCYSGEITSTWTPSAKRAMSAFMDRVNASLPVDEPDYILLTLVQGHTATACGTDCPSGQVSAAGGRCRSSCKKDPARRRPPRS